MSIVQIPAHLRKEPTASAAEPNYQEIPVTAESHRKNSAEELLDQIESSANLLTTTTEKSSSEADISTTTLRNVLSQMSPDRTVVDLKLLLGMPFEIHLLIVHSIYRGPGIYGVKGSLCYYWKFALPPFSPPLPDAIFRPKQALNR